MSKLIDISKITTILNKIKTYINNKLSSLVINSDLIADGAITEAKLDSSISIGGGLALNGILVSYLSSTINTSKVVNLGTYTLTYGKYLAIVYTTSPYSGSSSLYGAAGSVVITINNVTYTILLVNGINKNIIWNSPSSTVLCLIYDDTGVSVYGSLAYSSASSNNPEGYVQFV